MSNRLLQAEVFRGGATTQYRVQELRTVWIEPGAPRSHDRKRRGITISTTIRSKGGGETDVLIFIPQSDYETLLAYMAEGAPSSGADG